MADKLPPSDVCARPSKRCPNGATGTRTGYTRHLVAGERACDECRKANAQRMAERRACPETREADNERHRRWIAKHPDRRAAYNRQRRNRRSGTITAMLERDGPICGLCGGDFTTDDPPTLEHLIPVARWKEAGFGDDPTTPENCVAAHRRCNQSKSDKLPSEWVEWCQVNGYEITPTVADRLLRFGAVENAA